MNKKMTWMLALGVVAALVCFGAGYYVPHPSATTAARSGFTATGTFVGRTGAGTGAAAFGGGTVGSVVAVGNGTFTVQLPTSTSTTASTGTKLVLVNNSTEIDELETVPASNIQDGQTVTVAGTTNSDGSITASSVMIRPATTRTTGSAATGQAAQ